MLKAFFCGFLVRDAITAYAAPAKSKIQKIQMSMNREYNELCVHHSKYTLEK